MPVFESDLDFGDVVYLKTDPEQNKWIVCEIEFRPGTIVYHLACGPHLHSAYLFELSHEPNQAMRLGIDNKETKGL